jgi:chloramphenicol 3-O-phosphotransferase
VLFAASLKNGIFIGIGKRGPVFLPLDRHVIITGPTRSGKTSLAKKIIKRAGLPALVLDLSMELLLRSPTTCLEEGGNLSGGLRRKPQQAVAQKQRPVALMKHAAPQKTMNCPNRYRLTRHNYACEQAPARRVGLRRALERLSCRCRLTGVFTPASQHLRRSACGERAVADCEGR